MATLFREVERGSYQEAAEPRRVDDDPLSACVGIANAVCISVALYAWGLVAWLIV